MIEEINAEILNAINKIDNNEWFLTSGDYLDYKIYNNISDLLSIEFDTLENDDYCYYEFIYFIPYHDHEMFRNGGETKPTIYLKFYLLENLTNVRNIVPLYVTNPWECSELRIYKN